MIANSISSLGGRFLAAFIVALALWQSSLAVDQGSPDDQRARIEKMSPAEKERIERNLERFKRLSAEEREELRALDAALQSDPNREALLATMERYCAWLKGLTPLERAELQKLPPAERVERVAAIQEERQKMFGWMLSRADQRAVREWLLEAAPKHEEELLARSPFVFRMPRGLRRAPATREQPDREAPARPQAADQESGADSGGADSSGADTPDESDADGNTQTEQLRTRFHAMSEEEKARQLANIAWMRWRWAAPEDALPALAEKLSPRARERFDAAEGGARRQLVGGWLWQVEAPAVTWDEIERYLKEEIGSEEQAELMPKPRSELMRRLTDRYLAHHWGVELPSMGRVRGWPFPGFGPGGPRGPGGDSGRRPPRPDGQGPP